MRNGKRTGFVTTFRCVISIHNDIMKNAHHIAIVGTNALVLARFAALKYSTSNNRARFRAMYVTFSRQSSISSRLPICGSRCVIRNLAKRAIVRLTSKSQPLPRRRRANRERVIVHDRVRIRVRVNIRVKRARAGRRHSR